VAEGKSAKEIEYILSRSIKTVAFHKTAIFDALGVRPTAELTRYAIQKGMIGGSPPTGA
jgi:DNA-binding NarL/FixJ family response regulator